jgi:hypothetical protein
MLQSVSYGCCISRLGCCTCCNGCTRMLQASILNVSYVFSDVCYKCVYLDAAYIFTYMMQVFYLDVAYVYNGFKCFLCVFASVSDACFKCSFVFTRILQLLYLGVSKLDRVLQWRGQQVVQVGLGLPGIWSKKFLVLCAANENLAHCSSVPVCCLRVRSK